MEKQERVRLLLVEGDDTIKGRGGRISHGAASLVSRWPGYIASAIWFLIFVISMVSILMLLLFMLLVKEERKLLGNNNSMFSRDKHDISHKLNNEFCKEMTSESSQGKKELPNIEMFNSGNNIFYIRTKPLNKHSSCAVESVLKHTRNKNVFLMMFDDYELDYENELKHRYPNLILTKVNGNKYLKETSFKWDQENYNKSMIAAGLITIWQFGGTVLSDNLITCKNIDNHKESTEGSCLVDYELLSCAEQCSAFVYEFMNAVMDYNTQEGAAPIIEKSIHKFCGNGVKDCEGARRAQHICETPQSEPECEFIRMDSWLEKESSWSNIINYCPITIRYYRSLGSNATENNTTNQEDIVQDRHKTFTKSESTLEVLNTSKNVVNPSNKAATNVPIANTISVKT